MKYPLEDFEAENRAEEDRCLKEVKHFFQVLVVSNLALGLLAIDLYHGAAILNFSNVTKTRLEEQNSLVPICKMIFSIHYYYSIQGT